MKARFSSADRWKDIKGGITMIGKGKISSFEDNNKKAKVIPYCANDAVTFPLTIPQSLQGAGRLTVNTEVIYAVFNDNTGAIIMRLDGQNS